VTISRSTAGRHADPALKAQLPRAGKKKNAGFTVAARFVEQAFTDGDATARNPAPGMTVSVQTSLPDRHKLIEPVKKIQACI